MHVAEGLQGAGFVAGITSSSPNVPVKASRRVKASFAIVSAVAPMRARLGVTNQTLGNILQSLNIAFQGVWQNTANTV